RPGDVASMNYLATAHLAASTLKNALLIDMGTTTTDIIPIIDGSPQNVGQTDADRLASGELVYTGLTRTAVMAVVDAVPFQGAWVPICREYFATMSDVQRVLEALPSGVDDQQTADGRGKSLHESTSRLARMIGRDGADGSADDWRSMARYVAGAQFTPINEAVGLVVSRHPKLISSPIVTTGCAIASLEHWAKGQGLQPLAYQTLFDDPKPDPHHINTCATAAAIAALA
ncbi:MAG: hydantoinase/oxoprolinase family protein, partial [Pseudomonadota bacterium]